MTYISHSVGEDWVCATCGASVQPGIYHICGGSPDSGSITAPPFDIEKFINKAPSAATEDYLRRIAEALEKMVVWLYTPEGEEKP